VCVLHRGRLAELDRRSTATFRQVNIARVFRFVFGFICVRFSTMTAIIYIYIYIYIYSRPTVGHTLRATPTNGHRLTALCLPWRSPIQVLTEVDALLNFSEHATELALVATVFRPAHNRTLFRLATFIVSSSIWTIFSLWKGYIYMCRFSDIVQMLNSHLHLMYASTAALVSGSIKKSI